jgi:hypothetical protein
MKKMLKIALLFTLVFFPVSAYSEVDLSGTVQLVQIAPNGNLWFEINTTSASTYCLPGWAGLNMYVPADDPQYPYYFAMLMTAAKTGKNVYVANISVYNGSTPCDITKTGYGLVFVQ